MRWFWGVVLGVALWSAGPAWGQEEVAASGYLTGGDYLQISENAKSAYIIGITEGLLLAFGLLSEQNDYQSVLGWHQSCNPSMTLGQRQAVFETYLTEHPEAHETVANLAYYRALADICRQ